MIASLALALVLAAASPAAIRADAAVVLSGDVDYLRLQRAIELQLAGAVPMILLTGAGVGGDSAETMRKIALARGVPSDAIVLETRSRSTRENLVLAAPIVRARGWRRLLLVTSESHMRRALWTAQKALPEIDWVQEPVPDAGDADRARAQRFEEWLKLLWYGVHGWL